MFERHVADATNSIVLEVNNHIVTSYMCMYSAIHCTLSVIVSHSLHVCTYTALYSHKVTP